MDHRSHYDRDRRDRGAYRDGYRDRDDRYRDSRDSYGGNKRRKLEEDTHNTLQPVEPTCEILVLSDDQEPSILPLEERQKRLRENNAALAEANAMLEIDRERSFSALRRQFRDLCKRHLRIDDPKECFNRWIMERHIHFPYGSDLKTEDCDPIIPFNTGPFPPPLMFREIMEDVPTKLPWPKDASQVFVNISLYAEATISLISEPCDNSSQNGPDAPGGTETPEDVQEKNSVIVRCKDELSWYKTQQSRSHHDMEAVQARLGALRAACDPFIKRKFTSVVEMICRKIVEEADADARALVSRQKSLFAEGRLNVKPDQPRVRIDSDRSSVTFELGSDYFRIHLAVYNKLKYMWTAAHPEQRDAAKFDDSAFHCAFWALHYRYRTLLGGLRRFEGSGLQAAVPPDTFRAMTRLFDVSMEAFGSPFNCHFSNFCSVFDDLDAQFHSSGSFFRFRPVQGSFECNPPFCEELMQKMNEHLEHLLSSSDKPLSFIIFLPHWMTPPSPPIEYLKQSKLNRAQFIVEAHEHKYVSGFTQNEESARTFTPVHSSIVFFLQNEAGYNKWTPTAEKVAQLRAEFLPKQQRSSYSSNRY